MKLIWIFLKKIFNYIIQYNENGGFELEYLPINIKKTIGYQIYSFYQLQVITVLQYLGFITIINK